MRTSPTSTARTYEDRTRRFVRRTTAWAGLGRAARRLAPRSVQLPSRLEDRGDAVEGGGAEREFQRGSCTPRRVPTSATRPFSRSTPGEITTTPRAASVSSPLNRGPMNPVRLAAAFSPGAGADGRRTTEPGVHRPPSSSRHRSGPRVVASAFAAQHRDAPPRVSRQRFPPRCQGPGTSAPHRRRFSSSR